MFIEFIYQVKYYCFCSGFVFIMTSLDIAFCWKDEKTADNMMNMITYMLKQGHRL